MSQWLILNRSTSVCVNKNKKVEATMYADHKIHKGWM